MSDAARDIFYVEVICYGLIAEVGVNGVPLEMDETGGGLRTARPINDWLRPGDNTLNVRIEVADPELEIDLSDAQLVARVCLADPNAGGGIKAAAVLAEVRWPLPEPPEDDLLPAMFSELFELRDVPELRLWSEAQSLRGLSSLDRDDITAVVESLRVAIVSNRHEDAYDISAIKFEDDIRANGGDPAALRDTVIEQFGWMTSPATVLSDPVTRQGLEFNLCGDDRIVHVAQPGRLEAFEVIGDAMKAGVTVYVARFDGDWVIVR